jgi:hypothetical protein
MIIPLAITKTAWEGVAKHRLGYGKDAAKRAVVADLDGDWTLVSSSENQRTREPGGQEFVRLLGREFSYSARLPGYTLPEGWCICPPELSRCHCRESSGEYAPAVKLTGGRRLNDNEEHMRLAGDRYHDRFVLLAPQTPQMPQTPFAPATWNELVARWTRVQLCIRRDRSDRGMVDIWEKEVALRRRIARVYSGPVAYEGVTVDDELLAFALVDSDTVVARGAVYSLHGRDPLRLEVVDVVDGLLRCEASHGQLGGLRAYASGLRGDRRRLLLDREATKDGLERENFTIQDFNQRLARNPNLETQLVSPRTARIDETVAVDSRPIQPELDLSQKEAVERAFQARDLLVVQGPPGTGKTTFIAELVLRHLREHPGDTVLVASQTHQATDNLLRRVHRLDPDLPLVRIASPNTAKKIATDVKPFWLDEPTPWTPAVRDRAERYARFSHVQVNVGAWPASETETALAIQREYLGTDGVQPTRERRLHQARLVAGTCFGVSADPAVRSGTYGLAILEEAGKASPMEALMPMLLAEKTVLVGDSRQLPPTPDSALDKVMRMARDKPQAIADGALRKDAVAFLERLREARSQLSPDELPDELVSETLFTNLARRLREEHVALELTLQIQYRMATGIGQLISDCFYDGTLENGRDDARRDPRVVTLKDGAHVVLVNVNGHEEKPHRGRGSDGKSYLNEKEAEKAIPQLETLEKYAARMPDAKPLEVAVLTGYSAQRQLLHEKLDGLIDAGKLSHLRVRIGSIDSFQGDEAEVVIVSLVRTEAPGFMAIRNRVNVALSRARSLVIVLTNLPAARSGKLGGPLRDVVAYVDDRFDKRTPMRDKRYHIEGGTSESLRR